MENNRNNAYVQLPTSARLLAGFAGIIGKVLRTLAVVLVALLVGEMGFIPGLLLGVVIGMVLFFIASFVETAMQNMAMQICRNHGIV